MTYKGHVSYTNLASGGIVHSGDIQSAPHGAAEFIDIDLAYIRKKKNVRYVATQIYRYAGDAFSKMDCYSGWMIRDCVDKKYKSFDIKTVENKFDISGSGFYAIPVIIDIHKNEVIFVDLYVKGINARNTVEGVNSDISLISREMVKMYDTRPNMKDLALLNAAGRGAVTVSDRDVADITIGISDCDYNAVNIGEVLNEFI